MAVLGYLPKLKRGLGLAFGAHFLFDFSINNTLSMDKVSMSYLFSFSRYQTKCVIKFLFRQMMTSQSLRFIFHHSLKHWLTGRKRWQDGNTKTWISQEWKELFRWNKKHFSKFLKCYHLMNQSSISQLITSVNLI